MRIISSMVCFQFLAMLGLSASSAKSHEGSSLLARRFLQDECEDPSCDDFSPASEFPPLPEECHRGGNVPYMLGTYHFYGFRLAGEFALGQELNEWDDGMTLNEIAGTEYVSWQDGPYYMLAIFSPVGLVRRFCTFNTWDNRTSTCTGVDERDESVTELLYVQEATVEDGLCKAQTFGIVTTKAYVPGEVGTDTLVANMFVDKVQAYRECDEYPEHPEDTPDRTVDFCESVTQGGGEDTPDPPVIPGGGAETDKPDAETNESEENGDKSLNYDLGDHSPDGHGMSLKYNYGD